MNHHSLLINLIYKALKETDNNIRQQGQQEIIAFRDQDPTNFFQTCAELLTDQKNNEFIRLSSATLISRSISFKNNRNMSLWDTLDNYCKSNIKNCLLVTLINQKAIIMRAGANAISAISAIEIPRNQWLDLIDNLAENTQHQDFKIKTAAITTIGYICEQLRYASAKIDLRCCEQFLGAIIVSMENSNPEIQRISLVSLRDSLLFLAPLLSDYHIRNRIFNDLKSLITNEALIQQVYQALFQFARAAYHFLGDYLSEMLNFIIVHLQQKSSKTILSLELIDTIGVEYLDRIEQNENRIGYKNSNHQVPNILISKHIQLLPEVMKCLLIQNQADLEFPQLRNSASKTLGTMVAIGNEQTIGIIINGAATVLRSVNLGEQQAAAPLMSALCEYPNKETASRYINDGIQPVLKLLNSRELVVVANTLNGISTISQNFPQLFLNRNSIGEIVSKFFQIFHDQQKNSSITTSILNFFTNLTEGFNSEEENIILSDPTIMMTHLVNQFQQALDHYNGANIDIAQKISLAIMNFISHIRNLETIYHMIDFLIDKYRIYNQKSYRIETQMALKMILAIIQTCLYSLNRFKHDKEGLLEQVCHIIDQRISKFGIEEEGLLLIGAMVLGLQKKFKQKVRFYESYIFESLKMIDNPRVFKQALSVLGDIGRNYPEDFDDFMIEALKTMLEMVHSNIDKMLKVVIIQSIGDLCIGVQKKVARFICQLLQVIDLCFGAIYELQTIPDQTEYVEELKYAVVCTYSCILFSLFSGFTVSSSSIAEFQRLADHYPVVVDFIKRTCKRQLNPQVEYVKQCLTLMSDASAFLMQFQKKRVTLTDSLDSPQIKELVNALDRFSIRDDIRQLQHVMRSRAN